MPDDWFYSLVCEAFHCTPAEAVEQPSELTLNIMEDRAYADAWRIVRDAKTEDDVPQSPMVDLVVEFQSERMKAERERRQRGR